MHLTILTFSLTLTLLRIVRPIPLMVNNQLYRLRKSKSTTTQILNFHEDGDDDDDDDDDDENEIWEDVSDNGFAE